MVANYPLPEELTVNDPIAHVAEDGRVHGLEEPLRGTAEFLARFAARTLAGAAIFCLKRSVNFTVT